MSWYSVLVYYYISELQLCLDCWSTRGGIYTRKVAKGTYFQNKCMNDLDNYERNSIFYYVLLLVGCSVLRGISSFRNRFHSDVYDELSDVLEYEN